MESKIGTSKRRETPLLALEQEPKREDVFSFPQMLILILDNWSKKAIKRNAQGTGRMKYLKHINRKLKNGFREGTKPTPKKREVKK